MSFMLTLNLLPAHLTSKSDFAILIKKVRIYSNYYEQNHKKATINGNYPPQRSKTNDAVSAFSLTQKFQKRPNSQKTSMETLIFGVYPIFFTQVNSIELTSIPPKK